VLTNDSWGARIEIVPADDIHPHEVADPAREERIERRLREDGLLRDPLLVGEVRHGSGYVLLDGTNRRRALAALGVSWSMVQIIDYANRNAIELSTWCHLTPFPMAHLVEQARLIPGLAVTDIPALESLQALSAPGVLAVVLDSDEITAVTLQPGHQGSRTQALRQFVDIYEHVLTRVDCEPDELEERARELTPAGQSVLIAFPPFTRSQVVTMATRGLLIPAGITRHVTVAGRALRVNLDLDVLRSDTIEEAQRRLRAHLDVLHPRVYRETTILFDS
jgi:hypothetical protein